MESEILYDFYSEKIIIKNYILLNPQSANK
jgi:hypothetical protein